MCLYFKCSVKGEKVWKDTKQNWLSVKITTRILESNAVESLTRINPKWDICDW